MSRQLAHDRTCHAFLHEYGGIHGGSCERGLRHDVLADDLAGLHASDFGFQVDAYQHVLAAALEGHARNKRDVRTNSIDGRNFDCRHAHVGFPRSYDLGETLAVNVQLSPVLSDQSPQHKVSGTGHSEGVLGFSRHHALPIAVRA